MKILNTFIDKSRQQSIGFSLTITNRMLKFADQHSLTQTQAIQHLFIAGMRKIKDFIDKEELPEPKLLKDRTEPRSYKIPLIMLDELNRLAIEMGYQRSVTFNQIMFLGLGENEV